MCFQTEWSLYLCWICYVCMQFKNNIFIFISVEGEESKINLSFASSLIKCSLYALLFCVTYFTNHNVLQFHLCLGTWNIFFSLLSTISLLVFFFVFASFKSIWVMPVLNLQWFWYCRHLLKITISFSSENILKNRVTGSCDILFLSFQEPLYCFLWWLYQFTFVVRE